MDIGIKLRLADFPSYPWDEVDCEWVEVHVANFLERTAYEPLLAEVSRRGLRLGVHYFCPLPGFTIPTFAVDDEEIARRTLQNLRQCIDWAAERKVEYVVYHAGPRRLCHIDGDTGELRVGPDTTPAERSAALFLEHATQLAVEARERGVWLAVESETEQKPLDYQSGQPCELVELGEQSPETLLSLAATGAAMCVDFANLTTAFAAAGAESREELMAKLLDFCERVQKAEALVVHVVSVLPPFLRDTRSGLTNLDQELGVFPNRQETRRLLEVLAAHPHAVAIPEGQPYEGVFHNQLLHTLIAKDRPQDCQLESSAGQPRHAGSEELSRTYADGLRS